MSHGDWCPRATYQRIKFIRAGGQFVKEAFAFQSLNIFQHGHEVHNKWQTWLWEMGELWGDWKCMSCKRRWTDQSPKNCPKCASGHLRYEEIPLDAEDALLISGSADGGVPRNQALMEFKTVGSGTLRFEAPKTLKANTHKTVDGKNLIDYEGLWRSITRPFPAHQRQGQIYLHICKLRGLDFDKVVYIYESKFNQGTKEFTVKYRESLITPLLDAAEDIRKALDSGGPPPKCPKNGCKHCEPNKEEGTDGAPTPTGRAGDGVRSRPQPAGRPQARTAQHPTRRRGPAPA